MFCDPISLDILQVVPANPFVFDPELSARNVRSARRGRPVRQDRRSFAGHYGVEVRHMVFLSRTARFGQGAGSSRSADPVSQGPVDSSREIGRRRSRHCVWRHCALIGRADHRTVGKKATSPFQLALGTKAGGECNSVFDRSGQSGDGLVR